MSESEDEVAAAGRFASLVAAILRLAEQGGRLGLVTEDDDGWQAVLSRAHRLKDPRFLIAVCGEFSSGKSVLLGALMGRPELFPDGVGATTAVPTEVQWGPVERILICTVDQPDGFAVSATDLARYVTEQGNPRNEQNVVKVLIDLPSPLLADGICFVDLPGTGSTYAPHALVANAYLEQVDAAIFVTPSAAMTDSEVEFLRRVTSRVGDALVIALTKSDLISAQYGEAGLALALADLRTKAADGLTVTPDSLVIIAVSALNHQLALGDAEDEQGSGVPALVAAIEVSISARAGSLLATDALAALGAAFDDGLNYGRDRLAALSGGRTPEILKIQVDLATREAWLTDVADREPEWTRKLRDRLTTIGKDTFHRLNGHLHTIRTDAVFELQRSGDTLNANAFTSKVINQVHDRYVASASALEDDVNNALAELATNDLKLTLDRVSGDTTFRGTAASVFVEPVPARRYTTTTQRYGEAANRAARKSSGWRALAIGVGIVAGVALTVATGGAAAGGLAAVGALMTGAAVGGAAGAAAGTVAGTAAQLGEELSALDRVDPETRRQRLKQHVVDALTPNQSEAADRISTLTTTLLNSAVDVLKRALARERKLVEARIKQLNNDLTQTKAQAAAEAAVLQPQLATLDTELIPKVARLQTAADAEAHSLAEWQTTDTNAGTDTDAGESAA